MPSAVYVVLFGVELYSSGKDFIRFSISFRNVSNFYRSALRKKIILLGGIAAVASSTPSSFSYSRYIH